MRRRHTRRGDDYAPEVELPITPMLDMFFQILFFFVMTYHPSALEGQFPINLAAGEGAGDQETPKDNPGKVDPKTPPPVTITAKANERGRLESLDVTTFAGEKETIRGNIAGLGDESPQRMLADLERKLKTLRKLQEDVVKRGGVLDDRLLFRASPTLRWEETMRVLDSCRRAQDHTPLFPKIEMDLLK